MRKLLAAAVLAALPCPAGAATVFTADLTTAQETTPITPTTTTGSPRPPAFGTGTFTLNDAQTALTYAITVFNLDFTGSQSPDTNDNLTNAHIHAPAAPGSNAPVVFGFFGSPFNETSPNDVMVLPFATGVGGTISGKWDLNEGNGTTLSAQIPNLLAGLMYVNFHSAQFPSGEIRGQILPPSVPEPATWAMMLLGFGAVGVAMRRRKSARVIAACG